MPRGAFGGVDLCCEHHFASYSALVKRKWKALPVALLGLLPLLGTGCGGLALMPSISPASFFLPGLAEHQKAEPAPPRAEVEPVRVSMAAGPASVQ